jgi:hypothetical protein
MFIPVERANKVAFSAPEAAPAAVRGVFYLGTLRLDCTPKLRHAEFR